MVLDFQFQVVHDCDVVNIVGIVKHTIKVVLGFGEEFGLGKIGTLAKFALKY